MSRDHEIFDPYARGKLIKDETKGKPTWSPEEKFIEEMEKVRKVIN